MDVSRIDSTTSYSSVQQNQDDEYARKRVTLNQSSSFQVGGSQIDFSALSKTGGSAIDAAQNTTSSRTLKTRDGTEIEVPALNASEKANVEQTYGSLSAEGAERVKSTASNLASACYGSVASERSAANGASDGQALLEASAGTLRSAATDHVEAVSSEKFTKTTSALSEDEYSDAMTDAMTTGMSGVESELNDLLQEYTDKADMADEVDTDAAELQTMIDDWGDEETQEFTYHEVVTDEDGNQSLEEKTVTLTKEEAEALYDELKTTADDLSTISTADSTELQIKVQDYQQAMTTLSNIMKSYDENLKGIIQNIKA